MAFCSTAGCKNKPKHGESLCAKCKKQNGSTATNGDIDMDHVLINEVLWYADQHRHAASKESILKVLACNFSLDDLNDAKCLLLSKYGDQVNPERKKNRKCSQNRTEKMKVCEDIVDSLFDLDLADQINVTCVALDWKKTVKVSPEETPDLMLAEKVVEMEAKFKLFEDALSEMKARQLVLEEKSTPLMSEVVAGKPHSAITAPPTKQPVILPNSCQRPMSQNNVPSANRNVSSSENNVPENSASVTSSNSQAQGSISLPGGDFILPREQRRRQLRQSRQQLGGNNRANGQRQSGAHQSRRTVVGQSGQENGLRSTPAPSRDFFVYRVHKEDTTDVMKSFLQSKNVTVRDITLKSHSESKFNSYKLSVAVSDIDTVTNPEFWPSGICIRRWKGEQRRDDAHNIVNRLHDQVIQDNDGSENADSNTE